MDGTFVNFVSVSPELICGYKFSELGAPVTEMVYAYGIVSQMVEYLVERTSYYGGAQMPYVEGLCYIDGRIVDDDVPLLSLIG